MPGLIPQEIIDQVHERTNIVEVVSNYLPLKRSGSNFKTLCPFHHEKTPSFMVNPSKQIWHCFGCGLGGNAFSFVMKYENLEFPQAIKLLAKKAGVEIPEFSPQAGARQSLNKNLYRINELAANYFHNNLLNQQMGKLARQYLKKRGITEEIVGKFRLGFSLNLWDGFLKFAGSKGEKEEFLKQAGLIIPKRKGGFYDRFRNRLIFPIFDLQGRVIGFGGRVLNNDLPKYINSPETALFNKSRCLYGLNLVREYFREKEYLIVVEGYMDNITLYRAGIRNTVATLGTALTSEHARMLKRYVSSIVIIYDADQAGEAASLRGLDILIEEGLRVRIVRLTEGSDPDSYLINKGKEDFEKRIKQSQDLFSYKLDLLIAKYDADKLEEQAEIIAEMLPTIARVNNAVLRNGYIRRLAKRLSVNESSIMVELKKIKNKKFSYSRPLVKQEFNSKIAVNPEERVIVQLMLEGPELAASIKDDLILEDFENPELKEIAAVIFKLITENKPVEPSQIINYLKDNKTAQLISELSASTIIAGYETSAEDDDLLDKKRLVADCINKMKTKSLRRTRLFLQRKIKMAEQSRNVNEQMRLLNEFQSLIGKV